MNGQESEAKRIISSIHKQAAPDEDHSLPSEPNEVAKDIKEEEARAGQTSEDPHSNITQYSDSGEEIDPTSSLMEVRSKPVAEEAPRRRSTRAKKVPRES